MGRIDDLARLREEAKRGRDPTCADETLSLLKKTAETLGAARYLEIGAGEGLTAASLFLGTGVTVTAIERDPVRAAHARVLFDDFAVKGDVLEGDAGEILPLLTGEYDLIFLDGPKAQYRNYFADCKRLLRRGGALVSDDVFLYGWVRGEPPKKRRMLVEHIREYLALLEGDPCFRTEYYDYGEGVALSIRTS